MNNANLIFIGFIVGIMVLAQTFIDYLEWKKEMREIETDYYKDAGNPSIFLDTDESPAMKTETGLDTKE